MTVAEPHLFRWERLKIKGHQDSYVLKHLHNGHWLALLYSHKGVGKLRLYLPGGGWEEQADTDLEPARVPPGFWEDKPQDPWIQRLLLWLLDRAGLPDSFLELTDPWLGSTSPAGMMFVTLDRAMQEGFEIAFDRIRQGLPSFMIRPFSDALREARYQRTKPHRKTWGEAYPDDAEAIWRRIRRMSAKDDYVDSVRVALIGDRAGMKRFIRTRSCCGSHEWEIVVGRIPLLSPGRKYLVGYNYGH